MVIESKNEELEEVKTKIKVSKKIEFLTFISLILPYLTLIDKIKSIHSTKIKLPFIEVFS